MRRLMVVVGGVIVLATVNLNIFQKEQILGSGRMVLLELAPVDPRSLMQGDYMALRFAVENPLSALPPENLRDGRLVLTVDERGVGQFARFDSGDALASNEILIRYRIRGGRPKFGTNAFFFQEGHADSYADARYGEFRVAAGGDAILTALRNAELEVLGPR